MEIFLRSGSLFAAAGRQRVKCGSTSGLRHIQDPAPAREQVLLKLHREADALLDGEHPVRVDVAQHPHVLPYAYRSSLCDDLRGKSHCCRRGRVRVLAKEGFLCVSFFACGLEVSGVGLSQSAHDDASDPKQGRLATRIRCWWGLSLPLLAAERKIP